MSRNAAENSPSWHVQAWALRHAWKADGETGPTFNASVNGKRYWARFGASDPRDRSSEPIESQELSQYAPEVAKQFSDLKTTPDRLLLWFHHVPWDYRMASARSLWDELVIHYDQGIDYVRQMQANWAALSGSIDPQRHAEVADFLKIQEQEALWWRNASIAYFQSISKRPLPAGHAAPPHDLSYYQAIKTPYAPGREE